MASTAARGGLTKLPPDRGPICPACQLPEDGITFMWAEAEEQGDAPRCGLDRDDDS
jgi:hypothetical protein